MKYGSHIFCGMEIYCSETLMKKKLSELNGKVIIIGLRISNGRLYAIRGNYQFLTVVESRKYINFGYINPK